MYAGAVARNQRREQKNKELALVSGEERKYWRDARQSACFWQARPASNPHTLNAKP